MWAVAQVSWPRGEALQRHCMTALQDTTDGLCDVDHYKRPYC
eukprot:COSAG02_NODE_55248_length_291_cov_1.333333_1_plen_41_part_10